MTNNACHKTSQAAHTTRPTSARSQTDWAERRPDGKPIDRISSASFSAAGFQPNSCFGRQSSGQLQAQTPPRVPPRGARRPVREVKRLGGPESRLFSLVGGSSQGLAEYPFTCALGQHCLGPARGASASLVWTGTCGFFPDVGPLRVPGEWPFAEPGGARRRRPELGRQGLLVTASG